MGWGRDRQFLCANGHAAVAVQPAALLPPNLSVPSSGDSEAFNLLAAQGGLLPSN